MEGAGCCTILLDLPEPLRQSYDVIETAPIQIFAHNNLMKKPSPSCKQSPTVLTQTGKYRRTILRELNLTVKVRHLPKLYFQ